LWRYPALIQDARLGTIYLCGGWVVLVNVALFLWLGKPARTAVWYGAVAAVLLVTSLILYEVGPETSSVPVLVGQTGADMAFGDPLVTEAKTTAAMDRMVHQAVASGSRLTVFPEGVARMGDDFSSPPFHLDRRAPTLFGAQRGTGPVYQSAVGYDGTFKIADKTRLVIFGEFVPGRGVLPFLSAFHLPSGDLSSGEHGTQAVRLGSLVVGPLICFEGLFPDLAFRQSVNGAQILAVMSDDDWFMGSSAPDELKAGSIWRAVESGLPLVRSASLGYSLAVDGHGRILAEAPLGQEDALQVSVPVPDRPIVLWFQPAFPLIFLGIFLGAPLIARQKAISSFLIMVQ
jgi:apolipoprotein N-acyltransferase